MESVRNTRFLLLALTIVGCSKSDPAPASPDTAGPPVVTNTDASDAPTDRDYVLDFTGTPQGGRRVGEKIHIAFNIKLGETIRTFATEEDTAPGFVGTNDMATCTKFNGDNSKDAIEGTLTDLPPGDNAFVSNVDVELFTADSAPEVFAGICYGYRQNGKWTWDWAANTMGAQRGSHKYVSKIRVNQGPIDAIKLVFNEDMKVAGYVTSIKFVARRM